MNKEPPSYTFLKEIGFTLLSEGKTIKIKAEGYSMYPAVKPGSVIYIEPYKTDSGPAPGDIIAWKRESGFVVHRLVRIIMKDKRQYYITRGDSSYNEDDPVDAGLIAGRVTQMEYPEGTSLRPVKYNGRMPDYKRNRLMVRIILKVRRLQRIFS